MNTAKMKIELKSDLCMGSGYSFAQIVDTDIIYDDYGIPYIPGKRLKDLLRDAGKMIGLQEAGIDALFGVPGDDGTKGCIFGEAYIAEAEKLKKDIKAVYEKQSGYEKFLQPQNILDYYTMVRANTSIEENSGVAKRNSLRFTRVVSCRVPDKSENVCFFAVVQYPDGCYNDLEKCVKALRHIGLHRNRGLGNVRCSIKKESCVPDTNQQTFVMAEKTESTAVESVKQYKMEYVLKNVQPLMMSRDNVNVSEKYLRGQNILGAVSGLYIRKNGTASIDTPDFERLFLIDATIFENAMPAVKTDSGYVACDVAPLYYRKLKKTKKYVNVEIEDNVLSEAEKKEYSTTDGNMPKKVKDFIHVEGDGRMEEKKTDMTVIYHHSRAQDTLYTQEAIAAGQVFKGCIRGSKEDLVCIRALLSEAGGRIRIGKSKSAQYGTCEVEVLGEITSAVSAKPSEIKNGQRFAVSLQSDSVFVDENGYTTDADAVRKIIYCALSGSDDCVPAGNTYIEKTLIYGFNTAWRLQKPSIPAVKAGSSFIFTADRDLKIKERFVGEKNGEGYGKIKVVVLDNLSYCIPDSKPDNNETGSSAAVSYVLPDGFEGEAKNLLKYSMEQDLKKFLECKAACVSKGTSITPSLLGRITLMLKESVPENFSNPEDDFKEFMKRVDGIKREKEKNAIKQLLKKTISKENENKEKVLELDIDKMFSEKKKDEKEPGVYETFTRYKEVFGTDQVAIPAMWSDYLMSIFVDKKYAMKTEGK